MSRQQPIRRPPTTFGMRLRGRQWQIHHGNRIVARYSLDELGELEAETRAETQLRALVSGKAQPT